MSERQDSPGLGVGPALPFDFDQHYETGAQVRTIATYECYPDQNRLDISDPVWGEAHIGDWPGDELFVKLFQHPALQRLNDVELLSLPRQYMTMPGIACQRPLCTDSQLSERRESATKALN